MIIVRSSYDINHFTSNLGDPTPRRYDMSYYIVMIGSAKLLAKLAKKYNLPREMKYVIADYGKYVFINRIVSESWDYRRVKEELTLLESGLQYDIMLKRKSDPRIGITYLNGRLALGIGSGHYPYQAIYNLDKIFTVG